MKVKLFIFSIILIVTVNAQDSTTNELRNIYKNLEYKTSSFNDLKEKWIITDQKLLRSIFNQFIAKDELRLHEKRPSPEFLRLFTESIYNANIVAHVTKRYFDDEVESFSFLLRNNSSELANKLKLNVVYGSGKIDTLDFNYVVENCLKQNINLNDLPEIIISSSKVKKIFNSLNQNHLLKVDDNPISIRFANIFANEINNNRVRINILRNGDKIKSLLFKLNTNVNILDRLISESTQYLPDPITDGFHLKKIVGNKIYKSIKTKYLHIEVSKEEFNMDKAYNFDINLNFFNPELMFWQSTPEYVDKYLVSAFGKWGNDDIVVPGWYGSDYIAGAKLSYAKNISNPSDSSYSIALGSSFKGGHPFPHQLANKITFFSGRSIYFEIVGNPFSAISPKLFRNFKLTIEGKIRLEEYTAKDWALQETPYHIRDDFFTVRNYLVIKAKKYDLFNLNIFDMLNLGKFEVGIGYSLNDIHHLDLDKAKKQILELKVPNGNGKHSGFVDFGLSRKEGLFQLGINTVLNYNFTDRYGYIALKTRAMLNNTFGLELKFSKGFTSGGSKLPIWRNESYFLFSPIIRINY